MTPSLNNTLNLTDNKIKKFQKEIIKIDKSDKNNKLKNLNKSNSSSLIYSAEDNKNNEGNGCNNIKRFNNENLIKNVCAKSKPGKQERGNVKINQDSYVVNENLLDFSDSLLIGVFDGHGK